MRTLFLFWIAAVPAHAGIYYSAEQPAELPAQWRGFLLDQRAMRQIGNSLGPPSLLRQQYVEAAAKLETLAKQRALTADEVADLGAIYLRLNDPTKAIEVLRNGYRRNADHFRLTANLASAWQLQGDLRAAVTMLAESVQLAPEKWKAAETAHAKVVRFRLARKKNDPLSWDDLFGVQYVGPSGKPEPGKSGERKKLPDHDVAIVQQLALWFPWDGALLWQLGELANAHGDVRTAAAILDGCVGEFAMSHPDLRTRRRIYREEADRIAALPDEEHEKYKGDIVFKSQRPLTKKLDVSILPPIRADGANTLPWLVIGETTMSRPFKPTFHQYLEQLEGKKVAMTGFIYTASTDAELSGFMLLEFPVGCWFCETPESTAVVYVELPADKTTERKRTIIKVQGILKLNRKNPEQFLYTIQDAEVRDPD